MEEPMNLPCNHYINEWVWLAYYKNGWVVEEAKVLDDPYGIIVIDDDLDVGTPYWVGKQLYSVLKTMPITSPGTIGKTARTSKVEVYVKASRGGSIVVDGIAANLEYPVVDQDYTGKISVNVVGAYVEESQVQVETLGVYNLTILAIDVDNKRYEK
jgi:hypothetical protein